MTPLHTYVAGLGATIRPHPATEPTPGDGGLVVVIPTATWRSIDDPHGDGPLLDAPRTDTSAVILLAPDLHRGGFVPNVIATASIITPAVPLPGLLDAVGACMGDAEEAAGVEGWRVRARSVTGDDDDDELTLDLLGEYRVGQMGLALSSLVRARQVGGVTVLHQTHVTTLADQLSHHTAGLAAARWAESQTLAEVRRVM